MRTRNICPGCFIGCTSERILLEHIKICDDFCSLRNINYKTDTEALTREYEQITELYKIIEIKHALTNDIQDINERQNMLLEIKSNFRILEGKINRLQKGKIINFNNTNVHDINRTNNKLSAKNIEKSGIVYLIQPEDLIDTNIFTIGRTINKNLSILSRKSRYGQEAKIICVCECTNSRLLKKQIQFRFNQLFKPRKGTEYYEGDRDAMYNEFMSIARKHKQ